MNERVRTSIKVICQIFCTSAILSWANIISCPFFVNGIKNDKTSSKIHIIVCLLKTK